MPAIIYIMPAKSRRGPINGDFLGTNSINLEWKQPLYIKLRMCSFSTVIVSELVNKKT